MLRKSIMVVCLLSMSAFAGATEIQTDDETLQGTILGKQGDEIFLETRSGIINVRKADILSIDGVPYMYNAPKPPVPPEPVVAPAPVSTPSIVGPPPIGHAYPEKITENDLKEYYLAHREEFREPLKVRILSLGQAFFTRSESEIRSDPTSQGGWRDGGWIDEGQTVEPFEESVLHKIFDMSVGAVSPLMKDKDGVGYLLRVVERKESAIPPYEEISPKVLNKILKSRNLTGG